MKFTREQFNEIGPMYLDDFPVDSKDQELMFMVFNSLPSQLQGLAIMWGCNDTEFRDHIFVYLCEKHFNMTCEEYYKSEIASDYFKKGITTMLDLSKLK